MRSLPENTSSPVDRTGKCYTCSCSYDSLDRMASGPAGSVTYGDINHVHAATTLGSMPNPYASYDAMGNMTCRNTDTTSGHTCGSSPTGALMSYDNEGRLASWTAPSGTTATDGFLYDNAGNRVLQRVNNGSVTDTITFDGYSETVLTSGTTTTTKYYNVNGQRVAMKTNSTLSYLLSDVLGSIIALTSTGSTQAVQLFAPIWCPVYTIYKRQALPGLPPDLWSSHHQPGRPTSPLRIVPFNSPVGTTSRSSSFSLPRKDPTHGPQNN